MQNFNNHQVIQSSSQAPLIALGERLRQLRYHWPIFVIGMLLTVGCGFLYLRVTPQKYEVQASINLEPVRNLPLTNASSDEPERSREKSVDRCIREPFRMLERNQIVHGQNDRRAR